MVKRKTASATSDEEDHSGGSEALDDLIKPGKTKQKSRQKSKVAAKEEQDGQASDSAPLSKILTTARTAKKPKLANEEDADAAIRHNDEGHPYIDLGKRKRATVRTFKGSTFVDIREYYEASGTEKPGKKGISLSLEQWKSLKRSQGAIDSLFTESGK